MPTSTSTSRRSAHDRVRTAVAASAWQGPRLWLAAIWPVLTLANLAGQPLRAYTHAGRSDYLAFMVGGRLVGSGCLYCMGSEFQMQSTIVGGPPDGGWRPFVNPPLAALALKPLAVLPLQLSIALFMTLTVVAMVVAARMLLRFAPADAAYRVPMVCVVIAAVSLVPAADGIGEGQWTGLTLLAACGAVVALRDNRDVLGGLLLSTLLVKPQLVWLVPPALLIAQRWRAIAGFAAGTAVWIVSTIVLVGVSGVNDFLHNDVQFQADAVQRTVGVPAFAGGDAGFALALVAAPIACVAMWMCRIQLRADVHLAVAGGLLASVFCSPHVFEGDLMLLAIPIVLWARRDVWAALIATVPLGVAGLLDTAVPQSLARFEVVAMVGLFVAAGMVLRRSPSMEKGEVRTSS